MSIKSFAVAAVLALSSFVTEASASPLGFNGPYDYAGWSSYNSNGVYQHITSIDSAQQTLTLLEPDNCFNDCTLGVVPSSNMFSHVVDAAGTVSFNWLFNWDIDACCSGLNFYVNSAMYNLIGGNPDDPFKDDGNGAGFFSVSVNAGDIIAFDAYSADSCCEAATSVITNFDAPSSVPEPTSVALVALGLFGIVFGKRRKV
jgi:hypothetical protein